MATTNYPVNHPAAVKKWSKEVMVEALKKTSFLQYMSTGSGNIVQIKNDLKSEGDRIRCFLRMQLTGGGIKGDGTLEGNEESLTIYNDDVLIDQLRHAVRTGGKMSEQRIGWETRNEARDGLSDWWADRFDSWFFNQICSNTDQSDVRYTGMQATTASDSDHVIMCDDRTATHAATASLTASDVMSLTMIDFAVEKAKTLTPALRPVRVNNDNYFVLFLHPFQIKSLRTNTDTGQWLDIQKEAQTRGRENPIFSGSNGVYNGTIIQENTRVPTGPLTGGSTTTRRAAFCGAQAAAIAFGQGDGPNRMSWTEELFDYENQLGVAAGCIGGLKKTVYNSLDYATIQIITAASAG